MKRDPIQLASSSFTLWVICSWIPGSAGDVHPSPFPHTNAPIVTGIGGIIIYQIQYRSTEFSITFIRLNTSDEKRTCKGSNNLWSDLALVFHFSHLNILVELIITIRIMKIFHARVVTRSVWIRSYIIVWSMQIRFLTAANQFFHYWIKCAIGRLLSNIW